MCVCVCAFLMNWSYRKNRRLKVIPGNEYLIVLEKKQGGSILDWERKKMEEKNEAAKESKRQGGEGERNGRKSEWGERRQKYTSINEHNHSKMF